MINTTSVILVDEWHPNEKDMIVNSDGKLVIIPFDKIFNKGNITSLNTFIIKKDSYVKRLNDVLNKDKTISKGICHYINYFIKFYDIDNELLLSYIKLKYIIDNKKQPLKLTSFIKMLYSILFTNSLKEKITKMVEDNYHIDITPPRRVKYNQSMEFTNEHAKIMMMISMGMKIMVPIIFHYINVSAMTKEPNYIYQFYERLFYLFNNEIDIYNKLWVSTLAKVNANFTINKGTWEQREIFGTDPLIELDKLLKEKIISETMFKYTFDKNIISFNSVVMDKQLGFFLQESYDYNLVPIDNTKDSNDGLSGLDKLEINSSKIDESLIILSEINITKTIKRIKKQMQLKVHKNEIEFYKIHQHINKFHVQLVFFFYARYFGNYRDLNLLTRKQYLTLLILLKRRLQIQGNIYLPQILTSNVDSKLNTRTIQNTKFLMKIENSSIYQSLMKDKFSTLEELNKSNLLLNLLSTILNTTFTLVDYDNRSKLGEKIEIIPDMVSDEFLNFLNQL